MRPVVLRAMRSRLASIRVAWECLLRLERVNGPLAHPDALVHLIPTSVHQILAAAAATREEPLSLREAHGLPTPECACGHNPFLAFFVAGEQAMLEALIMLQAGWPPEERSEGDLAELVRATRHVAHSEIEAFCGVCILKHATYAEPTAAG